MPRIGDVGASAHQGRRIRLGVYANASGAGSYQTGAVLFENLELVRTIEAVGGRSVSAPDLFVRRLPPETPHFWRQRVRQAYDEFARPPRLIAALSILPLLTVRRHWGAQPRLSPRSSAGPS